MIRDKIKTLPLLLGILENFRRSGGKIGFTNGCFDIIHPGHVRYLEKAGMECDVLVVGLNSDASVSRIKGDGRPVNSQEKRAEVLAALESVGFVAVFDEDTPLGMIEQIDPDVIFKGGDWQEDDIVGSGHVKARGGRVVVVPYEDGHSTTAIIELLGKNQANKR